MVYGSGNPFPPALPSFPVPVVPPDSDPDDGNQVTVCFSETWLPFVIGALQQLGLQATWAGDDDTVFLAQTRAQLLIAMFGSRDVGCESAICIKGLIYDPDCDCIKQTLDGGATYFENPDADPRHGDVFRYPPVDADDPRCQAAANMVRWISDLIDEVVLVVDTAGTAEGLVAIVLPLVLELGPFGILIDLVLGVCFLLFSAGATAISAAFTSTVYDQLTCIFDCHISPDGTVTAAQLALIQADIASQIGGLVQTVLDAMFLLMGEVGLSNAGATGAAPSDCSACDCEWCYTFDFTASDGGFTPLSGAPGAWAAGLGWTGTYGGSPTTSNSLRIEIGFTSTVITDVSLTYSVAGTSDMVGGLRLRASGSTTYSASLDGNPGTYTFVHGGLSTSVDHIWLGGDSNASQVITSLTVRGTGTNPFGADNC